jgi:preprotein translocase subunit SecD
MNSNDPYYLCILLDNVVEVCPSISMPHIGGGVGFKFDDRFLAQRLSSILRNGQLPVELHVIKVETIYSQSTN